MEDYGWNRGSPGGACIWPQAFTIMADEIVYYTYYERIYFSIFNDIYIYFFKSFIYPEMALAHASILCLSSVTSRCAVFEIQL